MKTGGIGVLFGAVCCLLLIGSAALALSPTVGAMYVASTAPLPLHIGIRWVQRWVEEGQSEGRVPDKAWTYVWR